jgi:hypothetical protein
VRKGKVIENKSEILTIKITNSEDIKLKMSLEPTKKQGKFFKWNIECIDRR